MNADGTVAWATSHGSPNVNTQCAAITSDESSIFVNTRSGSNIDFYKYNAGTGLLIQKYIG